MHDATRRLEVFVFSLKTMWWSIPTITAIFFYCIANIGSNVILKQIVVLLANFVSNVGSKWVPLFGNLSWCGHLAWSVHSLLRWRRWKDLFCVCLICKPIRWGYYSYFGSSKHGTWWKGNPWMPNSGALIVARKCVCKYMRWGWGS